MSPRKVYRHADLERVLAPKSVAIVGVSTNAAGFGARTLQNMKLGGFKGALYPINSKYDRISDLRHKHSIGYCNITTCCRQVCPESITITENAIIPLKERVVDRFFDPLKQLFHIL